MKLDWRHITLIILSVLLVTLVIVLASMFHSNDEKDDVQESSIIEMDESQTNESQETSVNVEEASSAKTEDSEQSEAEESEESAQQEDLSENQQEESSNVQQEDSDKEEEPEIQVEVPSYIELPYTIPGTTLVVKQYNSYDGIFLEDGSDANVSGIGAIVVENVGAVGVEYADILIKQNDTHYKFTASAIPAGTMIVIQEASGAAYSDADIQECSANVALIDYFEMSSSLVEVVENESGTLSVTNIGSETIPCVRVFYKFALEKGSIYVGGITYTAKIIDLAPGVTQEVAPSHYEAGSSEIMMIRTYDTTE